MNALDYPQRCPAARRGFTLAELILALATTAMVATAVAAMSVALSNAGQSSRDQQLCMQEARVAMRQLEDVTRKAKLITACDSRRVALWMSDANNDGQINMTEMGVIEWNSASGEVRLYRIVYPASWGQWLQTYMDYTVDLFYFVGINNATANVTSSYYAQSTLLASNVSSFKVSPSPAPPASNLLSIEMTLGSGAETTTLRTAVQIRGDKTASVYSYGGLYYLAAP
ncbi:MAG: prepilin-type N-terminal cleavage/methylation domain-containing protein [Planctomycetaceae bacterium]|nr:prepilin-type N-terminal cleavage/methylation domain-containing protein [Planctomycetaceae bacterium]